MSQQLRAEDYTIGWVCALYMELAAAQEMLDEKHKTPSGSAHDTNNYACGKIGEHNVVIACLPEGQMGTNSAVAVAMQMKSAFRSIRFGLMVGIGGGVPNKDADYRLKLDEFPQFRRPAAGSDLLFQAEYIHQEGSTCRREFLVDRGVREQEVVVHYGTIASGNQVMKNAAERDRISTRLGGVLCFEMEAAGLMNIFPCLVIRGICDYADSHKNKLWQAYAAGTAAAYAKDLLSDIPAVDVGQTPRLDEYLSIGNSQ